jgi:membrane protein implicated in regulation of membrane protease activity
MEQWLWILVALITLGIEIATVGSLISIWFTIGALAAYVGQLIGLNFEFQILLFILGSLVSFALVRPLAAKYLSAKQQATNADRYIGRVFTVVEAISEEQWGAIKIQGVRWSCREVKGKPVAVGESVEVVALEGAKLVVKKTS